MRPAQRLYLIIVGSCLMPALAVIWARRDARLEQREHLLAMTALRLAVKDAALHRSIEPEKADERVAERLSMWVSEHPDHPCAFLIGEPLRKMKDDHANARGYHCGRAEAAARAILAE